MPTPSDLSATAVLVFPEGAVPSDVDLPALGLLLAIVGSFLLANSILFRSPRALVAQFFGEPERRLTSLRAYIFHRLQVHLGFLFLLVGFGLQLVGRFRPRPPEGSEFPVQWVGGLLVVVLLLELGGWALSRVLFRNTVRAYFRDHPPDLENDLELARELGRLFGVPPQGDDSVPSYLLRVRHRVGLRPRPGAMSRYPGGGHPPPEDEGEDTLLPHADSAHSRTEHSWLVPGPKSER
ncbi:MAG TPA: hypothetical protein ENJ09_08300 [Planctomycetes bacterium]|nr:hypothetical protein [Planctomycetota bacterium]